MMIGPLPTHKGGTGVGGVAVYTNELAHSLVRQGLKIHVVTDSVNVETRALNEDPSIVGVPTPRLRHALRFFSTGSHLPTLITSIQPSYLRTRRKILAAAYAEIYLRVAKQFDFDVIHTHLLGPPLEGAYLASKSLGKPLVATVHSLRGTLGEKYVHEVILPSLDRVNHIITVSDSLRQQLEGMRPGIGPITTVYGGYNKAIFFPINRVEARAQLGLSQDRVHILFVGNLVPVKGCDTLVAAFAQLHNGLPNTELHFVGAPRPYSGSLWLDRLMKLPAKLGIESAVHFHGHLDPNSSDALRLWYSAADCTVLPSLDEGFGLVLLESMACNTPVVGSSVGGILDILKNEHNGLTVAAGDAAALCASIKRLIEDEELRTVITGNLSETVARFSWEQSAQQVSSIYETTQTNQ
jgi:glycosyltransferase involved in cell wall biosynthesis